MGALRKLRNDGSCLIALPKLQHLDQTVANSVCWTSHQLQPFQCGPLPLVAWASSRCGRNERNTGIVPDTHFVVLKEFAVTGVNTEQAGLITFCVAVPQIPDRSNFKGRISFDSQLEGPVNYDKAAGHSGPTVRKPWVS